MKVLNLYAGIGGNRKLWTDVEVTAVEHNQDIANIYKDFYPDDTVIVGDAHEYLLEHFKEFDFIWSSPPCPTHSRARYWGYKNRDPIYPDMTLYQEIIFLKHHFDGKYCIENTKPYYEPLIEGYEIGRHLFWANFIIGKTKVNDNDIHSGVNKEFENNLGFDLSGYKINTDKWTGERAKMEVLRNCVHPETGLHILNRARNIQQSEKVDQQTLF